MQLMSAAPAIPQVTSAKLCHYDNSTSTKQLVRLVNSEHSSWEKTLFPEQKISFPEIPEGRLEVYLERKGKRVLEKVVYCYTLRAKS
ncbi:MAG: DUF1830 domain-containing protein [Waterburya sp.]